nr:glycosyltransferase family 2 protein [candidate division Zixibacteria bacterium]
MSTIAAIIITKNEEANIGRCLKSVSWADEIIVVDDGSTDRTLEIAKQNGARVYCIEWQGFGQAKNHALRQANSDWILSIDADEEITEELAAEIKAVINAASACNGYYLPRMTNFLGRWIKHSRWYPDYVLRLFRREKGSFSDTLVHEKTLLDGTTDRLKNHMRHFSYPDIDTYFKKLRRYSDLGAREMHEKGIRFYSSSLVFRPLASFLRHYVTGAGFLDGIEGLAIAFLSASGVMIKYLKLRALEKAAGDD